MAGLEQKFNAQMAVMLQALNKSLIKKKVKVAEMTLRSLVSKTPVDTGYARLSWVVSSELPNFTPVSRQGLNLLKKGNKNSFPSVERIGKTAIDKGVVKIKAITVDGFSPQRYVFTNVAPQIGFLEDGTDKIKAFNMMRKTREKIEGL